MLEELHALEDASMNVETTAAFGHLMADLSHTKMQMAALVEPPGGVITHE